jgi:hypothetical protein
MAKVIPLQHALKIWFATIGSVVFLFFGGRLSDFLISDPTSSALVRWLGVFVAAVTVVPWVLIVAWTISVTDEYYRQMALVGTSVAFVLDLMTHIAYWTMVDAGLVRAGMGMHELGVAACAWIIGVSLAATYYRLGLRL